MSMICPCGGVVTTSPLSQSREARRCKSCGRYEVVPVLTTIFDNISIEPIDIEKIDLYSEGAADV